MGHINAMANSNLMNCEGDIQIFQLFDRGILSN